MLEHGQHPRIWRETLTRNQRPDRIDRHRLDPAYGVGGLGPVGVSPQQFREHVRRYTPDALRRQLGTDDAVLRRIWAGPKQWLIGGPEQLAGVAA